MPRDPQRQYPRNQEPYPQEPKPETLCAHTVNEASNLHHACAEGHRQDAWSAIKGGADVREPGPDGWLPLHVASAHGHAQVAHLLLQQGSWVDARSETTGSCDGATALHVAVCAGELQMTQLLLRSGADPNARDDAGFCPLHIAASQGRLDIVRMLVKAGARADRLVADRSALEMAREAGHGEVVGLLQQL